MQIEIEASKAFRPRYDVSKVLDPTAPQSGCHYICTVGSKNQVTRLLVDLLGVNAANLDAWLGGTYPTFGRAGRWRFDCHPVEER